MHANISHSPDCCYHQTVLNCGMGDLENVIAWPCLFKKHSQSGLDSFRQWFLSVYSGLPRQYRLTEHPVKLTIKISFELKCWWDILNNFGLRFWWRLHRLLIRSVSRPGCQSSAHSIRATSTFLFAPVCFHVPSFISLISSSFNFLCRLLSCCISWCTKAHHSGTLGLHLGARWRKLRS